MSKFTRFQKILLGLIAVLLVFSLLTYGKSSVLKSVVYDPLIMLKYSVIDYPIETVRSWVQDFNDLWYVHEENDHLRYELSQQEQYAALVDELRRENEELQGMIHEFNKTYNPELIMKIIVKFENNRKGNDFGKINGKSINTDFEIDSTQGETSTITRNEILHSIITTIRKCKDPSQAKALYEMLNTAIIEEVSKFKKPGAKVLNDNGIPVVTKKAISLDDYFSTGRDGETGEYNYISSYYEFTDLKELFKLSEDHTEPKYVDAQEVGRGTIRETEQVSEIDETMKTLNAYLRNRENEQTKGENK